MKNIHRPILTLLSLASVCHGELLVYEPFDYQPHNHEIHGRLEGRNGGLGFAKAWKDTAGSAGYAFIYDQRGNPEDLYGGDWGEGGPAWDGVVDNLPTMGGYMSNSDWDRTGSPHSTRKLARSAGAMAKKNGGVLWLSAVVHMPNQSFFAPVGIALASDESGFKDRAIAMDGKADAIGAGNGRGMRERKRLNPVIWNKGEEVAGASGSSIDSKKDNIVILKFEFGETDKVSTWYFTEDQEMTEDAFIKNAASCSSAIDEDTLDVLTVCTILNQNAIDEIRIGTDFKSVIGGSIPARQEVKIIKTQYDAKSDRYHLEWSSNPGEVYGLYVAEDAGGYKPCVAAAVEADKDKERHDFRTLRQSAQRQDRDLKFEIGFPDTTPPNIERVWGSGNTLSIIFSEPMIPATSLSAGNYTIAQEGGGEVAVKSADVRQGKRLGHADHRPSAEAEHRLHHHHPQSHRPCQSSAGRRQRHPCAPGTTTRRASRCSSCPASRTWSATDTPKRGRTTRWAASAPCATSR